MRGEIFTKAAYARRIGVRPSAVSNYIARQKLTAPAVRADGTIDAMIADQQLDIRLVRRAGQVSNRQRLADIPAARSSSAQVIDLAAGRSLLQSKATIEAIKAERARRQLQVELGRYTLTEAVQDEWAKMLSAVLQQVEQSLSELAYVLLLDRERTLALLRWWRQQRAETAKRSHLAAEEAPQFIADPVT